MIIIIIITIIIITFFGTHYALPQCIYRNKNLSWPKITINILQNTKHFAKNAIKNAIKKYYENASWKRWVLSFLFKESKKLVVLIFTGRLFKTLGAATVEARSVSKGGIEGFGDN